MAQQGYPLHCPGRYLERPYGGKITPEVWRETSPPMRRFGAGALTYYSHLLQYSFLDTPCHVQLGSEPISWALPVGLWTSALESTQSLEIASMPSCPDIGDRQASL